MRTAVYIDGFNLSYWLKPLPFRWIDLKALALAAISKPGETHEIVAVEVLHSSSVEHIGHRSTENSSSGFCTLGLAIPLQRLTPVFIFEVWGADRSLESENIRFAYPRGGYFGAKIRAAITQWINSGTTRNRQPDGASDPQAD